MATAVSPRLGAPAASTSCNTALHIHTFTLAPAADRLSLPHRQAVRLLSWGHRGHGWKRHGCRDQNAEEGSSMAQGDIRR